MTDTPLKELAKDLRKLHKQFPEEWHHWVVGDLDTSKECHKRSEIVAMGKTGGTLFWSAPDEETGLCEFVVKIKNSLPMILSYIEKAEGLIEALEKITNFRVQAVSEDGDNLHDTTELEEVLGKWIHDLCDIAEQALQDFNKPISND